jgi:hypothetical protein
MDFTRLINRQRSWAVKEQSIYFLPSKIGRMVEKTNESE